MEDSVGFEPTEHFCSTVFKTVAINQTLPTIHMVETVGIEPTQNTGLQPVALPTELNLHVVPLIGFEPMKL